MSLFTRSTTCLSSEATSSSAGPGKRDGEEEVGELRWPLSISKPGFSVDGCGPVCDRFISGCQRYCTDLGNERIRHAATVGLFLLVGMMVV